ncbi:MAG TPA: M48 family metallopeptidase [Candidatus Polarisedimenticolia bacterium]|nr:M48 family metallopeptidase [Candidatus Polarisedimenticolia bacterium]
MFRALGKTCLAMALFAALSPLARATMTDAAPPAPEPGGTAAVRAGAPERITEYRLPETLHREAHFLSRLRFASRLFGVGYSLFILWLILRTGWSARFRSFAESASRFRPLQALLLTGCLALTYAVLSLPLDVFDEVVLKRYGISVQSWGSWMGDWAKVVALVTLLGSLVVWILYALIRVSPRRWWLGFWAITVPLAVVLVFLHPLIIDPLFFRFEPLASKAPQLVPELQRVARRAGWEVPASRMFWMEASVKSVVPNAYVTGVGSSKRIVVWDTTLAQETTDGIVTVFGHELGHYVLGHVARALVFFFAASLAVLYAVQRAAVGLLARRGEAWRLSGIGDWASLPALLLLAGALGLPVAVLGNAFSRYQENQADIYSLEVTHGILADPGQAAAASFQKFGEKVFVDPDPNPLYVLLFYDHPTVADRIRLFATYDPWSKGREPRFVK